MKQKEIQIEIKKKDVKAAWGEHLKEAGFERSQFDNKYRKRIVIWTKDGVDYTAKTRTDENGNLILSLSEYNY